MLISNVIRTDTAKRLDAALAVKGDSPILKNLGDPDVALKFMRSSLRGSMLFGRHVVPSFMTHVFASLTNHAPLKDGRMLKSLIGMATGEICTNNVYGRSGDNHAHFYDLLEAYEAAGGDPDEFNRFLRFSEGQNILEALRECPDIWSPGSIEFTKKLLMLLRNPLATFIIMPCNEILTTIVYPPALDSLSTDVRFAKFKRFLEVHVQLDGDDHGLVALDWLKHYIEQKEVSPEEIELTITKVLPLYEK